MSNATLTSSSPLRPHSATAPAAAITRAGLPLFFHAAARRLSARQSQERKKMSQSNVRPELQEKLRNTAVEPLLPIEKKLIAWSLSTGLVLLVVLATINHFFPPAS
jgi:hypothetical protein